MADKVFFGKDGDQYCVRIGVDAMKGRMGCGATPAEALRQLATEIELYGWTFDSGIRQEGRIPSLRVRFHPKATSTVRAVTSSLRLALELVPDPNSDQHYVTVENCTGAKLLTANLDDFSLTNFRAA